MGSEQAKKNIRTDATALEPTVGTPAPKEVQRNSMPTTEDELLSARTARLEDADAKTLNQAILIYTDAVFHDLEVALNDALKRLADPKRPPEKSLAVVLISGLVGTLTELALNYFTAGIYSAAKETLGHHAIEALHETTEQLSVKVGNHAEGRVEKFLENEPEREKAEKAERVAAGEIDDGEVHMMNPSARTLLEEFAAEQTSALGWRKAEVKVDEMVDAVSGSSRAEVLALAKQLQRHEHAAKHTSDFQKQIVFGWMNFCTQASLGDKPLVQSTPTRDVGHAAKVDQKAISSVRDAEGAINVMIRLPEQLNGVGGMNVTMSADTSGGAVGILNNIQPKLMQAPVLRRIYLQAGSRLLDQTCPIVLYPNGGIAIDVHDETLAAIGRMVPADTVNGGPNETFAVVGAQLVLNALQSYSLKELK